MKEVEIELFQHPYSTSATRQVLEFNNNAKVKAILDTIKDLARKCKWHKYRVGLADMWTGWKY
jgi:hypothetical protein